MQDGKDRSRTIARPEHSPPLALCILLSARRADGGGRPYKGFCADTDGGVPEGRQVAGGADGILPRRWCLRAVAHGQGTAGRRLREEPGYRSDLRGGDVRPGDSQLQRLWLSGQETHPRERRRTGKRPGGHFGQLV